MKSLNRKSYEKLQSRYGDNIAFASENSLIAEIVGEIRDENKVPFEIDEKSSTDETVNKYFSNSYAYVKFSK